MVLGTGGGILEIQLLRFLGLHVVFGLIDDVLRLSIIAHPQGGTSIPNHGFLHTIAILMRGENVVENALRLLVILFVEIGFSHHQVGIVDILHILLPFEKHRVLVDTLRPLLNHAVHSGIDARELLFGRIHINGQRGDIIILAQFGMFFLAILKGFFAVEIDIEAGSHVMKTPIDGRIFACRAAAQENYCHQQDSNRVLFRMYFIKFQ